MSKLISKREIAFQQREIAKNRLKNMMSEIAHQESLPKEPKPEKGQVGRPRGSIEKDTYKQPVPPTQVEYEEDDEEYEDEDETEEDEDETEEDEDEDEEQDIIYVQKRKAPKKIKKVVEKVQKPKKGKTTPLRGKTKVSGDEDIRKALLDLIQNMQESPQRQKGPDPAVQQPVEQPKSKPPSSLPYKRETVQMAYNSLLF